MKRWLMLILIISFVGFAKTSNAQDISSFLIPEINISVIPENPEPNSTVYISINSFDTDLNSASISWQVNSKTIKSGVAEKNIEITVGGITNTTAITVTIRTLSGDVVEKTISIRPSIVDLYWQSDSTTPPFYKGKALFSHQNTVTVVALPQITTSSGALADSRVLTYKWKKNGSVQESQSGYGKNTYTFISSIISRPLEVSVEVTSPNIQTVGFGSVNLFPREPELFFYEKKPLLGIQFEKAITGNYEMLSPEIMVVAYPYYFDANRIFGDLIYRWSINGKSLEDNEPTQVFRVPNGASGTSNISLFVENPIQILQTIRNSFRLVFTQTESEVNNF